MKRGKDYIGVGIGAVIFNDEGKMFVMKRGAKTMNERGKWDFPGGAVEFGETLAEAVQREMKEEIDIDVEIIDALPVIDHLIPEESQHWVTTTHICRIAGGEPKILEPEKCEEIGWFTFDQVEQLPLSISTKRNLQQLRARYPQGYTPA